MWRHVNYILTLVGTVLSMWLGCSDIQAAENSRPVYELDRIIQLALERNPGIEAAQGTLEQQLGRRIQSSAYPNPTLLGQTGRASARDPSTGNKRTEFSISLSQPLEWPGKRAARQQAAEADLGGAKFGVEEVRLHLTTTVSLAFYDLLLNQHVMKLTTQNLRIMKEVRRITNIRVRSGEAPKLEAIKADVELLKAHQDLTRFRNAIRVGQVRLNTLTGGALGTTFAIEGTFRPFQAQLDLDNLTAQALEQHPSIRKLQKQVDSARHTVSKERQSRIPNVTVFGGYAREIGREAVIGGLSLPTPLWYQRKGEISEVLGVQRKKEAELHRMQNEIRKAVNQFFQEASTASEQIDVFEKGLLKQAQEVLRIATFSFQQGEASLLDVLDAQRVARQIQLDYLQAQHDLSFALTRLERALGERREFSDNKR